MTTAQIDSTTNAPADAPPVHDADIPPFPLAGRLRLNLSALGVDAGTPDLGERLCLLSKDNEPYDFEVSAQGEIIVIAPPGWDTSLNQQKILTDLGVWHRANGGLSLPSTVMFRLPSGAHLMPDTSWISQARYDALLAQEYQSVIDGAPDFIVEIRSRTDALRPGLAKMDEWMAGGARLGWYIDPYRQQAHIYRAGQDAEILDNPETLSGEDVLPGFVFPVRRLIFARYANPPNPSV